MNKTQNVDETLDAMKEKEEATEFVDNLANTLYKDISSNPMVRANSDAKIYNMAIAHSNEDAIQAAISQSSDFERIYRKQKQSLEERIDKFKETL